MEKSACKLKLQSMINLFMKLRLFHALKIANQENRKVGGKRNRKMLKVTPFVNPVF